jgi:hypothetical protein
MEMNEKNIIYLIFIIIVFLFPQLVKLLTGKKLGSRRVEKEEAPDGQVYSSDSDMPGFSQEEMPKEDAFSQRRFEEHNEPIKPKMF